MIDFNGTYYENEDNFFNYSNSLITKDYAVSQHLIYRNSKPLFVEEHYLKIIAQMRILRMEIPMTYTPDLFYSVIHKFCKKLKPSDGVLQLRFFELLPSQSIAYSIELIDHSTPYSVEMELFNDFYIQEGKHRFVTTNFERIYELSNRFAIDQEVDGCFLLNSSKKLTDSSLGTLFCIKDSNVFTPSLNSGTRDLVSRAKLIEWIKADNNYELTEEDQSPFSLQKQDAVFVYSFKYGLIPVTQYRKKSYDINRCDYFVDLIQKNTLVE